MDEEEYQEEEQSNSKINLGSFFERVDSVEKVASNALSKANANFGIISAQKTLINTLNLSIEALETKVRDIANYIIIEKKITRDEEADRLVEERDEEQKNITAERLMGLKGDPGEKGDPGQPAEPEQSGGNPLMSFLKGIALLGIAGFAVTYLWPALLPLLKGVLIASFKGVFSWAGLKIAAILGGIIGGIPLIGKYGPKIKEGVEKTFDGIGNFVKGLFSDMDEDGNISGGGIVGSIPNVGGGNGGGGEEGGDEEKGGLTDFGDDYKAKEEYYQSKEYLDSAKANEDGIGTSYEDMKKTLEKKDLVKDDKKKFKVTEGEQDITIEQLEREIAALKTEIEKMIEEGANERKIHSKEKQLYIREKALKKKKLGLPVEAKTKYRIVEPIKEDNTIDSFSFAEDIGIGDSQFLSELINVDSTGNLNNSQNKGQVVNTPFNLPNTTETTVKFTDMKVPFLKSLSNQYLSISGKTIPPEYYRAFK